MESASLSRDVARVLTSLPSTDETTALPVLIMISGLPGTGKSFLARKIAERLPVVIVETDRVRKILFPEPTYASAESAWVHRVAHAVTEKLLRSGRRVIHDATNLSEWHRELVYRVADRSGARLVIVQTVAPEPVIRERLDRRQQHRGKLTFSDADWPVYEMLKREVDPVRRTHLVIDTTRDMDHAVARILRAAR